MSNIARMMQRATAGAGGAGLDVDEVFSCHLFEGNGGTQSIVNNIDLSSEGGLVWIKNRDTSYGHTLTDTARGGGYYLESQNNGAQPTSAATNNITSFNSNGFSIGNRSDINANANSHVSWTFRKAKNFCDIVTWSGTGNENNTINHNLGSIPGMIIVKRTDSSSDWTVYHRGVNGGTNPEQYNLKLNENEAQDQNSSYFSNTAPTETTFKVGSLNSASGGTYVAYLFAHNNNDGEFGPDADQDIIKCGSFTTNGSGLATVDLGFEPQFLIRRMLSGGNTWNRNWDIYDTMRGITMNNDYALEANTSDAEASMGNQQNLTPTGFTVHESTVNQTFVYMAIRRGPLAAPDDATKVFGIDKYEDGSGDGPTNGIVNDFSLLKAVSGSGNWLATSRLQGANRLKVDNNSAEASNSNAVHDRMDGVWNTNLNNNILWGWKRAPSYFDVVAYTGTGSNLNISHNLGVSPEMMWVKNRDQTDNWLVYHSAIGNNGRIFLNHTYAGGVNEPTYWNNTTPTSTQFN